MKINFEQEADLIAFQFKASLEAALVVFKTSLASLSYKMASGVMASEMNKEMNRAVGTLTWKGKRNGEARIEMDFDHSEPVAVAPSTKPWTPPVKPWQPGPGLGKITIKVKSTIGKQILRALKDYPRNMDNLFNAIPGTQRHVLRSALYRLKKNGQVTKGDMGVWYLAPRKAKPKAKPEAVKEVALPVITKEMTNPEKILSILKANPATLDNISEFLKDSSRGTLRGALRDLKDRNQAWKQNNTWYTWGTKAA